MEGYSYFRKGKYYFIESDQQRRSRKLAKFLIKSSVGEIPENISLEVFTLMYKTKLVRDDNGKLRLFIDGSHGMMCRRVSEDEIMVLSKGGDRL